jgi:hypothetical protein
MPDKETDKETSGPPPDQIHPIFGRSTSRSMGEATLWVRYSFAPEWFEDALHEAKTGDNHNARRREIVFAVCCAESYLFEWVRDRVLDRSDFEKIVKDLNKYFPSGSGEGVRDKWKDVLKQLKNDGFIPAVPDLSQACWSDFRRLVDMRNGLVHASASRPETAQQPQNEKPLPSKGDLDNLQSGWATNVVVKLIENLHRAVETPPPSWLVVP